MLDYYGKPRKPDLIPANLKHSSAIVLFSAAVLRLSEAALPLLCYPALTPSSVPNLQTQLSIAACVHPQLEIVLADIEHFAIMVLAFHFLIGGTHTTRFERMWSAQFLDCVLCPFSARHMASSLVAYFI